MGAVDQVASGEKNGNQYETIVRLDLVAWKSVSVA